MWEGRAAAMDMRCSLLGSLVFWPWKGCGLLRMKGRIAPGLPEVPDWAWGYQCLHPSCLLGMSLGNLEMETGSGVGHQALSS